MVRHESRVYPRILIPPLRGGRRHAPRTVCRCIVAGFPGFGREMALTPRGCRKLQLTRLVLTNRTNSTLGLPAMERGQIGSCLPPKNWRNTVFKNSLRPLKDLSHEDLQRQTGRSDA
jgi:hypothetical protein